MTPMRICRTTDVPEGEARRFPIGDSHVAVVNLGEGVFRALDAICSHEHAWLDQGAIDVEDATVECPKHGSVFELDTGRALTLPAVRPVTAYDVIIENDDILIEV